VLPFKEEYDPTGLRESKNSNQLIIIRYAHERDLSHSLTKADNLWFLFDRRTTTNNSKQDQNNLSVRSQCQRALTLTHTLSCITHLRQTEMCQQNTESKCLVQQSMKTFLHCMAMQLEQPSNRIQCSLD